MIDQVIFTTLNSSKCPKRNVPGGENCQTFWMVIFSIQFDLDVASGQKLEGNVTTLYELGLIRGKNRMMLMRIWEEERSKWNWLNLGIMDARNVASGSLPHTYHCHQSWQIHFWWTFVGGNVLVEKIFTEASRHRSEGLSKFYWRYLSAFPWDDSRKIDKVNNLAGLPGDGGEVLVGGEDGNVGKLETGAATEVLGQVAGQVVRGRKGINIICRF